MSRTRNATARDDTLEAEMAEALKPVIGRTDDPSGTGGMKDLVAATPTPERKERFLSMMGNYAAECEAGIKERRAKQDQNEKDRRAEHERLQAEIEDLEELRSRVRAALDLDIGKVVSELEAAMELGELGEAMRERKRGYPEGFESWVPAPGAVVVRSGTKDEDFAPAILKSDVIADGPRTLSEVLGQAIKEAEAQADEAQGGDDDRKDGDV